MNVLAFLKRQILWVLLGAVLVAEIVFLVLLIGRRGEAQEGTANLAKKVDELDKLARKLPGNEKALKEVLTLLGERKKAIIRERGECLLFFWDRTQALSRLFDDPGLTQRDGIRPWQEPADKSVFKDYYQRVYNREVEKLGPELAKVGADRGSVNLAAPRAFTEVTELQIGDIFAEQKRFWIIKDIVERAAKTQMVSLKISEIKRADPGKVTPGRVEEPTAAKFSDPLALRITVACQYPHLGGFLAELLRSPLCFAIDALEDFKGVEPPSKEEEKGKDAKEARPAKETEPGGKAAQPAAKSEVLVSVSLDCKVADFSVAVRQVRFTAPTFAGKDKAATKAKVKSWLDRELARLEDEAKDTRGLGQWAARANEEIEKAIQKAAAEAEKEKDKAKADVPILLPDRMTALQDRAALAKKDLLGIQYDFTNQPDLARQWVKKYPHIESTLVEARTNLLRQIRQAVEADKGEVKDGLIVPFWPEKTPGADGKPILDSRQMFEQSLDADGYVQVEYGLVLFRAKESPTPLPRAKVEKGEKG